MSQEEVGAILRKFNFENIDIATRTATHWLGEHLNSVGPISRTSILRDTKSASSITPGNMYFFSYNPKTKDILPFYDMFPLAIALKPTPGGFLGLNLHYLRYYHRAVFLNLLLTFADRSNWYETKTAKFLLEYTALKNNKYLHGTIKRYYFKQFISGAVRVLPKDWKVVPFLPIDRFMKASREEVFKWASSQ